MTNSLKLHRLLAISLFFALGAHDASAADQELLFVANADGSPVTAYPVLSSGPVSPVVTIPNPNLANTYWAPWGVAFDAQQNLYVQTFLSDATSFVYPQGADGTAPPSRLFRGGGPDTRSIALDANGFAYVTTGEGPSEILVLPPGASGLEGNLYSVSPVRSIPTDETVWHPWPSILTTDVANHVLAAVVRAQGNAIEFFDGGASGGASPIRTISGPLTGLGACADTLCSTMAITFSPTTEHLWAGVNAGPTTHVSLFASDAIGNTAPSRTIQGPATGLAGEVITGIAESPSTGELFVLAKSAQFGGTGSVYVFDATAQGNASPLRSFTDVASQFASSAGIAIVNETVGVGAPVDDHRGPATLVLTPNPTWGTLSARLSLALPARALVIQVFDLAGRAVATMWSGDAPAGTIEAHWDGRSRGRALPAGVYLVRASGRGLQEEARFTLVR